MLSKHTSGLAYWSCLILLVLQQNSITNTNARLDHQHSIYYDHDDNVSLNSDVLGPAQSCKPAEAEP